MYEVDLVISQHKKILQESKDAIKFDERFGEAYWSLANLKTYKFDKEELNNMELQIDNQDLPEREKMYIQSQEITEKNTLSF